MEAIIAALLLDDPDSSVDSNLMLQLSRPLAARFCSGSPVSADFALDEVANTAAATSLTSLY